jgi:hypothetical protein
MRQLFPFGLEGGPEPLDDWRLFLEGRKARGDFAIRDAALERAELPKR